ncbi:MAG: transcription termination factor NusA [Candidatus Marinimicrobia bacterium]|nr:transcription termination factor NusA [Candidatus Neomarinimicrobiota bacterium]MBT3675830.1 transcription termination factor NusA [Candidatus Neomarinimicrobiota bacterium]MBT3762992.1 transcription termination factor NusA [Candidatus Neomarinimicrobiota bacterium]MBT4809728.1 transcription termination factor NusA [Candidatus Neomarinimicrobiota bacterium]MBT6128575.1 transcription termination factor NusA [Candidatus Neomarinimicrobiota bacterium]
MRSNSSPFGGILVNRELIEVFSEIAREKNVERSELGSIIEGLFLHMVERERGDASNCSVIVNLDKGEFEIYVEKTIVDDIDDPVFEITLEEVAKIDAEMAEDLEIGDSYVEIINPLIFGRRLINMAKQYFSQRLQDVEKKYIYEDYANRVGEIVIGTVHQVQRDNTFVNIEHAELRMPRNEQIKTERYRRGDSVRAIIKSVEITSRGPDIVVSRSDNHFLYKLFEMEVPEIEDNIIDIRSISRHPGERAKIIVQSHDRRIDPVGACVGMRGSRIQAIVRELNNEKIDIINYSDQSEILISRALSPAKPLDLYIDDDRKYCIAIFDDDDLEFAIGRGGVNVNLAAEVTEYRIDAFGKKEYDRKQNEQDALLANIPDMPARAVKPLSENGISTVSELLNTEEDNLLEIKGIADTTLEKIYNAVQSFVEANQAEEKIEEVEPDLAGSLEEESQAESSEKSITEIEESPEEKLEKIES